MSVTFEDATGTRHTIPTTIYNTDLSKRWIDAVIHNQQTADKYIHSAFINRPYTDLFDIQRQLNDIVTNINIEYDVALPIFVDTNVLDENTLNEMHRQYEVYGTRAEDGLIPTVTLNDNFLLLNELIHTYEEVLHSKDLPIPAMSVLIDYYPQTEFYPILERDKLHLTAQFMWGNIYLGYNTLGKDWLKVAHDNDLDVIKRNMVKPQERFSAETWINFGPDDNKDWTKRQFSNWWYSLPTDLQDKVPIDNLNKLSLGRYLIGRVLVNDDYFLKYHNNINDWMTPNHPIKKKWNEEVFSKFRKVITIG
jgi:hypothetical protein